MRLRYLALLLTSAASACKPKGTVTLLGGEAGLSKGEKYFAMPLVTELTRRQAQCEATAPF